MKSHRANLISVIRSRRAVLPGSCDAKSKGAIEKLTVRRNLVYNSSCLQSSSISSYASLNSIIGGHSELRPGPRGGRVVNITSRAETIWKKIAENGANLYKAIERAPIEETIWRNQLIFSGHAVAWRAWGGEAGKAGNGRNVKRLSSLIIKHRSVTSNINAININKSKAWNVNSVAMHEE